MRKLVSTVAVAAVALAAAGAAQASTLMPGAVKLLQRIPGCRHHVWYSGEIIALRYAVCEMGHDSDPGDVIRIYVGSNTALKQALIIVGHHNTRGIEIVVGHGYVLADTGEWATAEEKQIRFTVPPSQVARELHGEILRCDWRTALVGPGWQVRPVCRRAAAVVSRLQPGTVAIRSAIPRHARRPRHFVLGRPNGGDIHDLLWILAAVRLGDFLVREAVGKEHPEVRLDRVAHVRDFLLSSLLDAFQATLRGRQLIELLLSVCRAWGSCRTPIAPVVFVGPLLSFPVRKERTSASPPG
jgi:hypothetical protein